MSNNNTVRWIAIIAAIILGAATIAFGTINTRLNKHDEIIMEIREKLVEIKIDLNYIKRNID